MPTSVADAWAQGLSDINTSLTTLNDAIDTEDGLTILRAIDGVRAQISSARVVVDSAV